VLHRVAYICSFLARRLQWAGSK